MKTALNLAALAAITTIASAQAQSVADFYKANRLTIYVGSSAGGGTDIYGRRVAQFIGKHLPGNPGTIVKNLPGANGLVLANQLATVLPKDGTAVGTFDRNAAMHSIWGNPKAKFDATQLNWIGSANVDISTCVTWHTSGIDTLDKFMGREVMLGATAVYHANILNALFGAKLKQVTGYRGGNGVLLALERGEVQGRCNWSWSSIAATRPDWVKQKKINVIIQFADKKHPELPNVPLIGELVKTDKQRQMLDLILSSQVMARPFAAPPGVPAERVTALRAAFMALEKDPAFIKSAKAQDLEFEPVSGDKIQSIIARIAKTPKPLIRELRDVALGPEASAAMDKGGRK